MACLGTDAYKRATWLTKNYHFLDWNSGHTPLHKFAAIVKDLTEKADIVYVKGKEKSEFLRKYSAKPIVELDEQPSLGKNIATCFYHLKNDKCACSLKNVFLLYDQFVMQS